MTPSYPPQPGVCISCDKIRQVYRTVPEWLGLCADCAFAQSQAQNTLDKIKAQQTTPAPILTYCPHCNRTAIVFQRTHRWTGLCLNCATL